jgi:hypothetical protein
MLMFDCLVGGKERKGKERTGKDFKYSEPNVLKIYVVIEQHCRMVQ